MLTLGGEVIDPPYPPLERGGLVNPPFERGGLVNAPLSNGEEVRGLVNPPLSKGG